MERASVLCPLRFPDAVRPGRAGEADGLMSEAVAPQSVTIAAVPGQVGLARAFVALALGESHPDADVAVLLASGLVTNSVLHSRRRSRAGWRPWPWPSAGALSRVEVTDRAGLAPRSCCRLRLRTGGRRQPGNAAGGHARRKMGLLPGGGFITTWFELRAKLH